MAEEELPQPQAAGLLRQGGSGAHLILPGLDRQGGAASVLDQRVLLHTGVEGPGSPSGEGPGGVTLINQILASGCLYHLAPFTFS